MGILQAFKFNKKKQPQTQQSSIKNLLLEADVSYTMAELLTQKTQKSANPFPFLQKEIKKILKPGETELKITTKPFVIFMYGINGSGKTTTIQKLVYMLQKQNKKVIVAACDTFRAAAPQQLTNALQTLNCEVITPQANQKDPASIAFIASKKAQEQNVDVLIIDTAGRLHTNTNLIAQLQKIHKVTQKNLPNASHANIAIMDATIGQNSIVQIEKFNQAIPISGIIITKLDTPSKGGATLSVIHEMKQKIYFTCTGKNMEDLHPFNAEAFAESLLS